MCLKRAQELDGVNKHSASANIGGPAPSHARRSINFHQGFDLDDEEEIVFNNQFDEEDCEYLAAVHKVSNNFGAFNTDDDQHECRLSSM